MSRLPALVDSLQRRLDVARQADSEFERFYGIAQVVGAAETLKARAQAVIATLDPFIKVATIACDVAASDCKRGQI